MSDAPGDGKAHKNDMYGDVTARSESDEGVVPLIPSATVVLLREADAGPEVLMLRKNSKISFGGMWVFPGGKIDDEDRADAADDDDAARRAAARETEEETGLIVKPDEFSWFARWTPPPGPAKRFTTWFFAVESAGHGEVTIDDGEIKDHAWVSPAQALEDHAAGNIDLVPPTWVTLYHMAQRNTVADILQDFDSRPARSYHTRVVPNADGVRIAMWYGDAGYDGWDADAAGERHRLTMAPDGFVFESTVETY